MNENCHLELVARYMVEVRASGLLDVQGTIVSTEIIQMGSCAAYQCTLDDNTAELDLLFLGRAVMPGVEIGMICAVTGRAAIRAKRLVVWNPRYELQLPPSRLSSESVGQHQQEDRGKRSAPGSAGNLTVRPH